LGYETERGGHDNQRLEFLGDAVLQLIFTELLFDSYPDLPEGELTKLRARLVSREGLRINAEALDLGKYLMMGEKATGGRSRASALADAYEALIGVFFILDSDYVTVHQIYFTETRSRLKVLYLEDASANPKGRLQNCSSNHCTKPHLRSCGTIQPTHETIAHHGFLGGWSSVVERVEVKDAEVQAARKAIELRTCKTSFTLDD
jgi:dsRNA-specific ribonuclease